VGPLIPTTLFDNTVIYTCPGRPLPLVWDFTVMVYAFLRSIRLPISQVGHSGLSPCPSYLLSFSAPKLSSLHFHIILHINTPIFFPFAHPLLPNCIHPLSAPSPSIFAFFGTISGYPLLLIPLPTFIHHIGLFPCTPHLLHEPSHSLAPAFPPTHPFLPLNPFLDAFLCSFQF
jgi:hypothetical protein